MVIMPGVLVFSSVKMCAGSAAGIYWIHGRKSMDLFWISELEFRICDCRAQGRWRGAFFTAN
jgi:hypothetical protein